MCLSVVVQDADMGVRCRVSIRPCNPHPNGPLGEARDDEVDSLDLLTRSQLQSLSILSTQGGTIILDVIRPFVVRTIGIDHHDVPAWWGFLHLVKAIGVGLQEKIYVAGQTASVCAHQHHPDMGRLSRIILDAALDAAIPEQVKVMFYQSTAV